MCADDAAGRIPLNLAIWRHNQAVGTDACRIGEEGLSLGSQAAYDGAKTTKRGEGEGRG